MRVKTYETIKDIASADINEIMRAPWAVVFSYDLNTCVTRGVISSRHMTSAAAEKRSNRTGLRGFTCIKYLPDYVMASEE